MRRAYRNAHFVGAQASDALAVHYASSDVFVFPSRTDTFGMVLLEALACGLPVAALPVAGPLDVIGTAAPAFSTRICAPLASRRSKFRARKARAHALTFTWANSARQFLDNIILAKSTSPLGLAARPGLFG